MAKNFISHCLRFSKSFGYSELKIHQRLQPEAKATIPVFTNKKYLGGFKLSPDFEYVYGGAEGNPIPRAVQVDEVPGRLLEKPLNLADNYKEKNIIDDSYPFWQAKMKYYYQWLIDTDYFKSRESTISCHAADEKICRKPDIVAVNQNIIDFLVTPYKSRNVWCIYARRFKGTIYLRSTRDLQPESEPLLRQNKPLRASSDISKKIGNEMNEKYHVSLEFKRQVLQLDSCVKQHEKVFAIYETDFDKYKILTLNTVLAVESDSDPESPSFVEINLFRSMNPNTYLRLLLFPWTRSVILDQKKIIVGQIAKDRSLMNVNVIHTEMVPALAKEFWQPHVCFDFLKRLLDFISQKVDTEDPNVVFRFQRSEFSVVTVTRLSVKDTGLEDDFKAVIPQNFVDHFDGQKSVV